MVDATLAELGSCFRQRRCEDAPSDAPRPGCGCRACYVTREDMLDPFLREVCRSVHFYNPAVRNGRSREIVYRYVMNYLSGRIEWAGLYPAITEALLGECDRMFQFEMARIKTAPFVMKMPGEKDG